MKRREAPVVPGRLYGLRAWTVGGGRQLESIAQEGAWANGSKATKARCAAGRGHRAPAHNCGCGLYALHPTVRQCQSSFDDARRAAQTGEPGAGVVGIVAAWGEVELHETGFRAEYARPHAFVLPVAHSDHYGRRIRVLAADHGAEVWEVDSGHHLHRRCVEQNLGLGETAVKELLGTQLRGQRRRERLRRWRDALVDVASAAAALVIGGFFWWLILFSVVVSLLSGGEEDPAPAARSALKLQILEQGLLKVDGSDFYVALVRNPSRTRDALQVHPTGAFLDEFGDPVAWPDRPANTDSRPSLAPGQVGVVYDWLDSHESVADEVERYRVRIVASRWVAGRRRSPTSVSRLRLERPRCLVTGTVRSAWRRIDAEFAFVVRNRRGKIIGAGTWIAGPLPRGRSRRILERIEPRPCLRRRFQLKAYPNLHPGDLLRST